jgi:hypothetical protein
LKYPKLQPPKSQYQNKIKCGNPHEVKRDEVATITFCKLKLKKYILYLTLSIGMWLYQEGCYVDCQQSLMLNKSLNTQVRWVKYNGHTHSTSLWTRKNWMVRFPKSEGPVCSDELQRLVFKYRLFWFSKLDVLVLLASFQWLVFEGQV